jgi:periplasmic copper chaperone A
VQKIFYAGFLLYTTVLCANPESERISVREAWIRAAPPAAMMMAGYLEIENNSNRDLSLLSLSSDSFGLVEVHRSYKKNGMMSMEYMDKMPIKKGDKVVFQPGGYHFMLMDKKAPVKIGDEVEMTLKFSHSINKTVVFTVRRDKL